ncbi:hypothetical protein [Paraburkholderia sp. BL10I2N1]|uniref:hypothetical protein n=1 Tax=Paraburkholderia sp. BL10I2N1 TaxID=1938796 RepID=UPI0010EA550D|nr:hypothetical protein [Paraburkholderia sp. BL10I2N1]TDN59016.1 hypothetical protein B0G77_8201 [Paraburkholderia sp. BL10I2N1]
MSLSSFICGAATGVIVCIIPAAAVVRRRIAVNDADPWLNPPTREAHRLLEATRRQLYRLIESSRARAHMAPRRGVEMLSAVCPRDGVIVFDNGVATLTDGTKLDVNGLTSAVIAAIGEAYVAMDAASSVLTDYAATLSPQDLENHPQAFMRAIAGLTDKYPMQSQIVALARLLDIDPESNALGIGGAELWRHNQARLFGDRRSGRRESGRLDTGRSPGSFGN